MTDGVTGLIIDVSAVDVMDSYVTRVVRDLALTARLMGVDTVVSGMQANVAITIIEMGLEIPGVATTLNLEQALEHLDQLHDDRDREVSVRGLAWRIVTARAQRSKSCRGISRRRSPPRC